MAYTFLLQTSEIGCLDAGTIKFDSRTGKYVGAIHKPAGKDKLSFIEIEIGSRLTFIQRNPAGEHVTFTFRPDPECPEFPESVREVLTWWIGESYDGIRVVPARCVLSLSPPMMGEPVPQPARSTSRCAVLDPMPHAVSLL